MSLDRLENQNTLRAVFRCTNIMRMALLDGEMQGLDEANKFMSYGKSTVETRVLEIKIDEQLAALKEKGLDITREDLIAAVKKNVEHVEKDYRGGVEVISLHVPQI